MLKILCALILVVSSFSGDSVANEKSESYDTVDAPTSARYAVGDTVKCSQWEESYWEGKVVKVVKDVLYQIEIETVHVEGAFALYLNASECTGKKRLSFENGKEYYETKIWVHERCLD